MGGAEDAVLNPEAALVNSQSSLEAPPNNQFTSRTSRRTRASIAPVEPENLDDRQPQWQEPRDDNRREALADTQNLAIDARSE